MTKLGYTYFVFILFLNVVLFLPLTEVYASNSLQKNSKNLIVKKNGSQKKILMPNKKSLERKMVFSDQQIKGQYQIPGEGLITAENEKPLLNLVTIRSDFKDRRAKEMQRD